MVLLIKHLRQGDCLNSRFLIHKNPATRKGLATPYKGFPLQRVQRPNDRVFMLNAILKPYLAENLQGLGLQLI